MDVLMQFCLSAFVAVVLADCNNPPNINNTKLTLTGSPPFPENTTAEYRCNSGYTETGTSRIFTCTGDSWAGKYSCDEIYCGYVETPENGKVTNTPTYKVGTVIAFVCNEGYDLIGRANLVCRIDGNWNYPAPKCNPKMCGDFGDIANGETYQVAYDDLRNSYKSVVTLDCNLNYILSGSRKVTCGADGNWGTKPKCERISCPPYPGMNSSCIAESELMSDGTTLYLFCKQGDNVSVTETGNSVVYCENNAWDDSGTLVACYCDCKIDADLSLVYLKNLNQKGFLKHGDELDWSCKKNALKAATEKIVCNDGKAGTPICASPITPDPTVTPILPVTTEAPDPSSPNCTVEAGSVILENVDEKDVLKNGEVLVWSCLDDKAEKIIKEVLRCMNGKLVTPNGESRKPGCRYPPGPTPFPVYAIIIIVVAVCSCIGLLAGAVIFLLYSKMKKKRRDDKNEKENGTNHALLEVPTSTPDKTIDEPKEHQ